MLDRFKIIFEILGEGVFTISYGVTQKTLAMHFKPAFKGLASDKAGKFAEKLFEAIWDRLGCEFGCVSNFPGATICCVANGEFIAKFFRPLENLRYHQILGPNSDNRQPITQEFRQRRDCYAIYASAFSGLTRAEYLLVKVLEVLEKMAPKGGQIFYEIEMEMPALFGEDAFKATKERLRAMGYSRFKNVGDEHHLAFLGYGGQKGQIALIFWDYDPDENQEAGWRLLERMPFLSPKDLVRRL